MTEVPDAGSTLIVACGALAHEVTRVVATYGWAQMAVTCLPAHLHNRPNEIPEAVRNRVRAARGAYDRILVLYGDCGTAGRLDAVLAEEGVERIPGAHCYAFYTGETDFAALSEQEPGSFFLTDYLVRHFDRLIIQGLGLDRYPQLLSVYFGNYRRLVHLAQTDDPALEAAAKAAALRLGLEHESRFTGISELAQFIREQTGADSGANSIHGGAEHRLLA